MMTLTFNGWLECRLATDFDPSDEPRGVSGWTYAVAGEPDLDQIIRTTPAGIVRRRPGPQVGVAVRRVELDGKDEPHHVLRGAPVELLDRPVFEGRNGLATEDAEEPIVPFHLQLERDGVRLRREFRDLATNEPKLERARGVVIDPAAVAEAGLGDPEQFVPKRIAAIEALLAGPPGSLTPTQRNALEARLGHLRLRGGGPIPLALGLAYHYVLEGPWVEVRDPHRKLKTSVDLGPWIADLWVGCWDADALCAYMKGTLRLPTTG